MRIYYYCKIFKNAQISQDQCLKNHSKLFVKKENNNSNNKKKGKFFLPKLSFRIAFDKFCIRRKF